MTAHRTLPLLLASLLLACSPTAYRAEIAGFSSGVDAVVASYRSGQQAIDDSVARHRQATDARSRTRLLLLPGCDATDPVGSPPMLADCAVVAFGEAAAPAPTAAQRVLADAAPAFNALKRYAAALMAIEVADNGTVLTQAAQSLATQGLAVVSAGRSEASGELKSTAATNAAETSLIGQGIAIWLDQRRLAVLRDTVPATDPAVQVLGQTLQAALAEIRAQQLLELGADLREAAQPLELASVGRLGVADYQSKLAVLQSRIAAFNQARAADPAATIAALVNAHHQLALAVQDNAGQETAVLTGVLSFVAAAEDLKSAIGAADGAKAKVPKAARK